MPWTDTSLTVEELHELALEVGSRDYMGRRMTRWDSPSLEVERLD
jgi:hypothetical protein